MVPLKPLTLGPSVRGYLSVKGVLSVLPPSIFFFYNFKVDPSSTNGEVFFRQFFRIYRELSEIIKNSVRGYP